MKQIKLTNIGVTMKKLWIAACAGLALTACATSNNSMTQMSASVSNTETMTLREAYQDKFLIGTALSESQIMGYSAYDQQSQAVSNRQFSAVTAENSMKWEEIQPKPGQFNFKISDKLVELAEKNNQFVIGHTLLWHQQTPNWVFEDENGAPASRELLLSRLKNHIDTIVGRYKGRIQAWDVVNEALNEDGTMRQSKWYQILGEDYIAKAFEFAHAADPNAELYYNDYNLWMPKKRQGAVSIVQSLLDKNIPITAIGMQAHYSIPSLVTNPDLAEFEASIIAYKNLGIKVMLTEVDITVIRFPGAENQGADISISYELQDKFNPYSKGLPESVSTEFTQLLVDMFKIIARHQESISRVTFWGVNDSQTWRNGWPIEGRTDYPLLFDRQNKAKPAVNALIELSKTHF
ncbi:endo-1,4-beta-xylanase [Catenovulum sp. 2E275]|uniref:endo-1,4-beta-xylanase n=1 Tax=Catenovulum sp. 2E275 TaxID=2980497 RepID=UPI0021D1E88A|nr:endo-1,4-beta-xylanase [Catenovulum sp. 2E275]MCU4674041.1 endo-1,4-beta-xylanase [Catenovulum sp. 2E275]